MSLTQTDIETIKNIVDEELKKQLPEILGRSLVQIKEYLTKNII